MLLLRSERPFHRCDSHQALTGTDARLCLSIQVDVELYKAMPPDILYHGTAKAFVKSIMSRSEKTEQIRSQTTDKVKKKELNDSPLMYNQKLLF